MPEVAAEQRMSRSDSLETLLLQRDVERFLVCEAAFLDDRRYQDWLRLMAPDIRYVMPARYMLSSRDQKHEFSAADELATFDEDMNSLKQRVVRLGTGTAWAEEPPSITRRFLANVDILSDAGDDSLSVRSVLLVRRVRGPDEDIWTCRRDDLLRRTETGFLLAFRRIEMDETIIKTNSLSILF